MLIKEWMGSPAITIDGNASLADARRLMKTCNISILPVTVNGAMAGIVTARDIEKQRPGRPDLSGADPADLVSKAMTRPVKTISHDRTMDEAAGRMIRQGIPGMPVLNRQGGVVGMVTRADVIRCFASFTGVSRQGQIFAFRIHDRPGIIQSITDLIRASGGRPSSIMTSYDHIEEGFRKVYFHVFGIGPDAFETLAARLNQVGDLVYAADLSRDIRSTPPVSG